jgi:hypothetical protein
MLEPLTDILETLTSLTAEELVIPSKVKPRNKTDTGRKLFRTPKCRINSSENPIFRPRELKATSAVAKLWQ